MEPSRRPDSALAKRILPAPLYEAAVHVFAQNLTGCVLVGGTALAGYYAGHRRSDDLDFFVETDSAFKAAVLAVQSLGALGVILKAETHSAQYFHAVADWKGHSFTIDIAIHPGAVRSEGVVRADDGVLVCTLEKLTAFKAAALLSRCAEKDLYDLVWLFEVRPGLTLKEFMSHAAEIDAASNPESFIISLTGTKLSKQSCGFSEAQGVPAAEVFRVVETLRKRLLAEFANLAENQPGPELGRLIRQIRKLSGKRG